MDWELFYSSFRKPDFIPGFEIQNRLGGGAFGDVYKARRVSIDKAYAIKFLKIDEAASRAAIERELEQVRHFSAIDHPNLVTIEDMGVVLDVPYLVMGYAGEDTLARRLRREKLPQAAALSLFVQICRGVAALHERRLAHFDLKPSNVFLKGDVARVGDYGLAKLLIDGRQTLSFGRGTPHYMAPEMLKNRADERADIYSLGVILYELFAGKLPFETSEDAGVVLRETDEPPPFPEEWPLRLKVAVGGCLRLDPARRFQTVPRLLEALGQSAGAGDPLVALESLAPWSGPLPGDERDAPATEGRDDPRARPGRHAELRTTATDLTRGAVEVARGVWEGLKSPRPARNATNAPAVAGVPGKGAPEAAARRETTPTPTPAPSPDTAVPTPPPAPTRVAGPRASRLPASAADVSEARAPGTPPPVPRAGPASTPVPVPVPAIPVVLAAAGSGPAAFDDVVSIETLEEAARGAPAARALPVLPSAVSASGVPASAVPAVSWAGTPSAAVPVPPRAAGGVFAALRATFEVGIELFTALLTGPVRRTVGGVGRVGGRFVRGGQGWFLTALRLVLFLTGMLALGAGLMYLVFLSLHRT